MPGPRTCFSGVAMAFKRRLSPIGRDNQDLEGRLAGLGMAVACAPIPDANIEDTLLEAVQHGMEADDLRILGLVTAWLERYHAWVNADRIIRRLQSSAPPRTTAYWISRAQSWATDIRWKRLRQSATEPVDLLAVGTTFQVARHGEDPRFQGTVLRVPKGTLRDRPGDVEPAHQIALRHPCFRWRIVVGPGYRADCLALVQAHPTITPAELARRTYASFATAWAVVRDVRLLQTVPVL